MADEAIRFNSSLNTTGFDSGAKQLQSIAASASSAISGHFAKIAAAVVSIGAAFIAVRSAAQAFNAAIAMGGQLNDLSARTGETAGNLAILQRAFQNAGAGADSVGPTINRLQRAIVEAGQGGKEQAEAFNRLGLSIKSLKEKTPTDQLQAVAGALQNVGNDSDRTAIAMQLLGRSGGELIPLLRAMGVELDIARNQLGSTPEIIDKTAAQLDRIGDNFAAIGEKGKEFMVGLLEKLGPGLADLTDRLANIDAAGFGAKLSEYAVKTAQWITETLRLSEALNLVETAVKGITTGNFGDGLKLMFLTARDTAFNAINQIVAAGMAALSTVGDGLRQLFDSNSTTMAFIRGSFNMLGAHSAAAISDYLLPILENIPFMEAAAKAVRAARDEAKQAAKDIANIMYYEADNLKSEWANILAGAPKAFGEAYKQYAANPLIDMRDRTKETAELAEKLARAIRSASFDAKSYAEAMGQAREEMLAGGPINPLGDKAKGGGPLADGQKEDTGPYPVGSRGSGALVPTNTPQTKAGAKGSRGGSGGGSASQPKTALQQLQEQAKTDARARAELMKIQARQNSEMARASELLDKGFVHTAANQQIRAERDAERRASEFNAKQLATDRFGGNNMAEAFRNYREDMRQAGVSTMGETQKDFEKWAREQAKTEKQRQQEQQTRESTNRATGGPSGGGGLATEATLQKILTKIKERPILVA